MDVTAEDAERWVREARAIAEEAGRVLMRGHRRGGSVRRKGAIDLVTEHDLASERVIVERLRAAFPDHTIVAEESAAPAAGGARPGEGLVWYVDPLDGTTNFAHGHFAFCVSLGLAEDGVPIAGVVHAPALALTWHGARGLGAFRDDVPCAVSTTDALDASVVATGFPYDRAIDPDHNVREASRIIPNVQGFRRVGSAALDLVLVADGTYDGYWEQKLAPWDLCGGAAIAAAAGATLTTYEGAPIDARSRRVVVTNGRIHEALRAEILAARAELDAHAAR